MGSQPYYLGITPFSAWVTVGSRSQSQSAHSSRTHPISLALAALLIAQEETWFILLVHSLCQVYTVYATKCHQTSVTEELGIVLNERHV